MLVWPFFAALGTGEKTILPPPRHATRIAVPRALFVPHKLNSRPLRVRGPIQPRKFDLMRALNKIHMLKLYYIASQFEGKTCSMSCNYLLLFLVSVQSPASVYSVRALSHLCPLPLERRKGDCVPCTLLPSPWRFFSLEMFIPKLNMISSCL